MIEISETEERRHPKLEDFFYLADNLPEAAWIADGEGNVFWFNRRWYDYTGSSPEEMEGWGWQAVHHPDTLPEVLVKWKAALASGEPFEMVFVARQPSCPGATTTLAGFEAAGVGVFGILVQVCPSFWLSLMVVAGISS